MQEDKSRPCLEYSDAEVNPFFPPQHQMHLVLQAQKLCLDCPVFDACESWRVLSNSNHGVWAGRYYDGK